MGILSQVAMASQALPDDLACCRVSAWLPLFRDVTFKTVLLPLPQEFVDFLVADGVHLAEDSEALARRAEDPYASDDDGWESGSSSGSEAQAPQFPELMAQMRSAIAELGGAVVPKFTWSCPKDAVWMTLGQTLACHNPDEVVLLLKSSDRVAHDICDAVDGAGSPGSKGAGSGGGAEAASGESDACKARDSSSGAGGTGGAAVEGAAADAAVSVGAQPVQPAQPVQHVLALRRWHDLRPEREFRCFVRGHELVGVCQRDVTEFYPSLLPEKQQLQQRIAQFHEQHIKGRFPLPHYTYDVYVAATAEAVRLIDFNPIGGTTAPLLFEWEELPFGDLLGQGPVAGANASRGSCSSSGNASGSGSGSGIEGKPSAGAAGEAAVGAGPDNLAGSAFAGATAAVAGAAGAGESAGDEAVGAAEVEVGRLSLGNDQPGEAAGPSCSHANASCPACSAPAASSGSGDGGSGSSSAQHGFEFRVIEEPVCMRPHKLAYGVPFDFVDSSEGSALDQLRRQMEGAAAGELFAALQKQAS